MPGARHAMYTLMMLSQIVNWFARVGHPQLVPFVVADLGLTELQRGLLLGSFFPSYVAAQIPASLVERLTGAKALIVANLCGIGGCLLAMPAAANFSGAGALVFQQIVIGVFAGLLFPVQKVLLREWAPVSLGAERIWALRASAFGMQLGIVGTTYLTPRIASQLGWRAVPRLYGGAAVLCATLWHFAAANTPTLWRGIRSEELSLLTGTCDAQNKQLDRPTADMPSLRSLPLGLMFRSPVLATFWINVADNSAMYTLQQWSALWFIERHSVSAPVAGGYLAVANAANIAGQFVSAAAEARLLRLGRSLQSIRRLCGGVGSVTQALSVAAFGLAPTPCLAACIFSVHNLAESFTSNAYEANYIEFGGQHCATLYSVGNALANIPGVLIAAVGAYVRARTGSLVPLFLSLAIFQAGGGIAYGCSATTTTLAPRRDP